MAGNQEYYIPTAIQNSLMDNLKKQVLEGTTGTSQSGIWGGFDHRYALEAIDKEYYRDNIYTYDKIAAAIANQQGNKKKLQDIVVPLAEGQTDTMHAYLTSVFLTGNPIFGVTASPDNIEAAKQYQAILSDQATQGGWVGEFMDFFHNGLKYFGAMEVTWCQDYMYSPEAVVRPTGQVDEAKKIIWQGNRCKNLDVYNFFWDKRVPLTKVCTDAEYAGYVEIKTRTSLRRYVDARGIKMNMHRVFPEDGRTDNIGNPQVKLFYIPDFMWNSLSNLGTYGIQNPGVLGSQFVDDFSNWEVGPEGNKKMFKNIYYLVTRYMRIIPKDYGMKVPNWNQVQIWKFVTINDQFLIEAERQNNNHDLLPIVCCQPALDALLYNNRSFVQKQIPMQDITSALLNAALDGRRRALADRIIYDPSKIDPNNMSSTSPSARIPLRPSAYGTDVTKAAYKIPFEDNQESNFLGTMREVFSLADMMSGQNKAQQGQFVKGNKTQREYEDVQAKSSGRQRKVALKLEQQALNPAKTILKANILQYQPNGELYNYEEQQTVKIDRDVLRKAMFAYTITDGLMPEDKIVNAEVLQVGMQTVAASPLLQSKYDLGKMFTYMMSTQNVDLKPFLLQQAAADEQLAKMAAAGLTPGIAKAQVGIGAGIPTS